MNELVFVIAPLLTAFILAFLYFAAPKENVIIKVFFLFGTIAYLIIGNASTVTLANQWNETVTVNGVIGVSQANLFTIIFVAVTFCAIFFVLYINAIFKKGMNLNRTNRETHEPQEW